MINMNLIFGYIKYNIYIKFILIFASIILFRILFHYYKKDNLFFEYENAKNKEYCKSNALLVYDYVYSLQKPHKYVNIGDYIQSLAALQYIPKKCKPIFIERDTIQYYYGPKAKLIMNGWFNIQEGNKYPSDSINPIYISYHLEKSINDNSMVQQLKKYQPIGCRDKFSLNLLLKHDIQAYFSSCLTTTLDITYFQKESYRNNEILFTDYKFGYYEKADKYIQNLKAYNFSNITFLTHEYSTNLNHIERFKIANNLLKKYARAKLVITTRIHSALPCLALKTPAILINKIYDKYRFDGLYELLNTIAINSKGNFEINVNLNKSGFVYNSDKYLNYSLKLKKRLKEKIK